MELPEGMIAIDIQELYQYLERLANYMAVVKIRLDETSDMVEDAMNNIDGFRKALVLKVEESNEGKD